MSSTRLWLAAPLWFATLAAIVAVLDAGHKSDTDPMSPGIVWVLKVLVEVSNLVGMGRTMLGMIVVTLGLIVLTILYGLYMIKVYRA